MNMLKSETIENISKNDRKNGKYIKCTKNQRIQNSNEMENLITTQK